MDILSRLGITIEGSFAETVDGAIRDILNQFGLEEALEKVSGDNEKLKETAADYRQVARDLRGVVDDLEAERKKVLRKWDGEASEVFKSKSLAFEEALSGEAEDMDTIATLLDSAAESCRTAEQLMMDLLIEIIEAVIAGAATSAIISLLTAGIGAVVGPLITAAGVAQKALRATRITAELADKLSDLNRQLQAVRRAEKLVKEIKRFGSKGNEGYRKGLARNRGWTKDGRGREIPATHDSKDLAEYGAFKAAQRGVKKGVVAPAVGADVGSTAKEAYAEYAPSDLPGSTTQEPTAYDERPQSQRFDDRMQNAESSSQKKVREDFG